MSGVAGVVYARPGDPHTAEQSTTSLLAALRHRGPDATAMASAPFGTIGCCRLAVHDLVTGAQPALAMHSRFAGAFNGEIYNYRDLRNDLVRNGIVLAHGSEVEVLTAMVGLHGWQAFRQLRGQYGIAVLDRQKGSLYLARDEWGICPLYYTLLPTCIMFASESTCLAHEISAPPRLETLVEMATLWSVLPSSSFWRGVDQVPPGEVLVYEGGRLRSFPLRHPGPRQDLPVPLPSLGSPQPDASMVMSALTEAVEVTSESDVPVGISLSGD